MRTRLGLGGVATALAMVAAIVATSLWLPWSEHPRAVDVATGNTVWVGESDRISWAPAWSPPYALPICDLGVVDATQYRVAWHIVAVGQVLVIVCGGALMTLGIRWDRRRRRCG